MIEKSTTLVEAPGARLYCEALGRGPTLLMISPGMGDCGIYSRLAESLADRYRVVIFDRRGNSRSPLDNPEEDLEVAVQSDDACRVLKAVGAAPAYLFGGSGGAIIGLDLTARYPEMVRALVSHEPPLLGLLPDAPQRLAFFDEVHDLYRREGALPAMQKFSASYQDPNAPFDYDPEYPPDPELPARLAGNTEYFLSHEMRPFTRYAPDVEALKASRRRIVLGRGTNSRDRYPARCGAALRELLDAEFVDFPGDHTGYLGRPKQFAETLHAVLQSSGE